MKWRPSGGLFGGKKPVQTAPSTKKSGKTAAREDLRTMHLFFFGSLTDRELLLRAFAAQTAIDWPELEAAIGIAS